LKSYLKLEVISLTPEKFSYIIYATDCLMKILRIFVQKIIRLSNDRLDSLMMIKFIVFNILLADTENIHLPGVTCVENERNFLKFAGVFV
jgi:hypothetical protein